MPAISEIKSSWADEVELDSGSLPQPTETYEKDLKIVTSYKFGENDKKIQIVRTYKISKQIVSKTVAQRKTWAKYGDSAGDKAGPSAQTTMVSEDINMQFITNKEEEKTNELALDPSKNIAKCRICSGEHWSVNCHYKGTTMEKLMDQAKPGTTSAATAESSSSGTKGGKYVPPFLKDGGGKGGMSGLRGRDDTTAIRISNLSESMVEADLEELVKKFGPHNKMYLARDKNTGLCKGFAYVHFKTRKDAQTAIDLLNKHGYDHLILNVEWSKPQTQN